MIGTKGNNSTLFSLLAVLALMVGMIVYYAFVFYPDIYSSNHPLWLKAGWVSMSFSPVLCSSLLALQITQNARKRRTKNSEDVDSN